MDEPSGREDSQMQLVTRGGHEQDVTRPALSVGDPPEIAAEPVLDLLPMGATQTIIGARCSHRQVERCDD